MLLSRIARCQARLFSRCLAVCSLAALCACGTTPLQVERLCPPAPEVLLTPPAELAPLIPNRTAADDQDADIPLAQLLDNHAVNAQACFETREQLQALIRWHREATP